jgi:glycosyltransferase involved in cell wall biosynthesis
MYPLEVTRHRNIVQKCANYLSAALRLPFLIARHDVVYIFCPGYVPFMAAMWAKLLRVRFGLYVRGTWLNKNGRTPKWWEWVFRGSEFMIVTGEAFRRLLAQYGPRILNEVPLTELRPQDVNAASVLTRGRAQRLLYAGRLTKSKGILDIIRALADLHRTGSLNVTLTIAGGGSKEEFDEIERVARSVSVWDAVEVVGHVPPAKLAALYGSSDVFVFPSYYAEGFPRVIYEAMMYGMDIVTTDMPGTEGFLVNGRNCILCRPSDPESVTAAIRKLIADPELAARLAVNAYADVRRLYASFQHGSHAEQLVSLACEAGTGLTR